MANLGKHFVLCSISTICVIPIITIIYYDVVILINYEPLINYNIVYKMVNKICTVRPTGLAESTEKYSQNV